MDKETEEFNLIPLFPCKLSWNFNKKKESNNILNMWKMTFQASNKKGRHFLDLLDNDSCPIEPLYSKGGLWVTYFG